MKKINSHKKFTILIPCFNERLNLINLILKIYKTFKTNKNVEIILIENGSKDNSKFVMRNLIRYISISNLKVFYITKNNGYGYGLKNAIKNCNNNIICITHADLQCDLNDCLKASKKFFIFQSSRKKIFIKGARKNRNKFDHFFTISMSKIINLLLNIKLEDINAQPKIFDKNFINLDQISNNFLFDLDLYLNLVSKKFELKTLPVYFKNRHKGEAKGGGSLKGKIKLSIQTLNHIISRKLNGNHFT